MVNWHAVVEQQLMATAWKKAIRTVCNFSLASIARNASSSGCRLLLQMLHISWSVWHKVSPAEWLKWYWWLWGAHSSGPWNRHGCEYDRAVVVTNTVTHITIATGLPNTVVYLLLSKYLCLSLLTITSICPSVKKPETVRKVRDRCQKKRKKMKEWLFTFWQAKTSAPESTAVWVVAKRRSTTNLSTSTSEASSTESVMRSSSSQPPANDALNMTTVILSSLDGSAAGCLGAVNRGVVVLTSVEVVPDWGGLVVEQQGGKWDASIMVLLWT